MGEPNIHPSEGTSCGVPPISVTNSPARNCTASATKYAVYGGYARSIVCVIGPMSLQSVQGG